MFDHCLYFNTTALSRLLEREWSAAFKPFDLTPPQAFLLRLIIKRPGLLQRELASAMTVARPTATRLLDGLEEKGLIKRHASASDGRESVIQPTEKARNLGDALNQASAAVTTRFKKRLGDADFGDAVTRLRSIRQSFD